MASTRQQYLAEAEQIEREAGRMLQRAAELRRAAHSAPHDSPFIIDTSSLVPEWMDGLLFHIDTGSGLSANAYEVRDVSGEPSQGLPERL